MEKILIVHNHYQFHGGEDTVVGAEMNLLLQHGHEVELFEKGYDELKSLPRWKVALNSIWSRQSARELREVIDRFKPDIVHFHNSFPLVSYGSYIVAASKGLPIVQTMHNFRWLCAQSQLFRNQKVCEDCIGHFPWRGVLHGCYRGSKLQTAASLMPLAIHRALGTFQKKITLFIALNNFCRSKFIEGGLPEKKFRVKPNFMESTSEPIFTDRGGGLFVGRLSKEKGLDVLAKAVSSFDTSPVKVIGGGELENLARDTFGDSFLGFQNLNQILKEMGKASFLVLPSNWYENFPRTIVESFASGLPVIASHLGAMAELVKDGVTGLLFNPGDSDDLRAKIQWAIKNPIEMIEMGRNAFQEFQKSYTGSINYKLLIDIYREAISCREE